MYNMHLIINTHWDREYRWSFGESQIRLGEAVDDLIDIMQKDKGFAYFHTDSQVSMLDDYLELRPERREELQKLVKEGRILTGPWYTLPAEFLVSGEALTRNLLLGHKISKDLGNVMKAGYNIFSWGQVSQLPQLYRQFGMNTIIFYRGIDQSQLDTLEFKWKAPDGNEALGMTFGALHRLNFWKYVYLPYIFGEKGIDRHDFKDGEFLFNLCDEHSGDINHSVINQHCERNIDLAMKGMQKLIDTVKDKSSTEDLLFLQGFDLENPDPIVTELVQKINERSDFGELKVANLIDYMQILESKLKERGIYDNLPVKEGEMLAVEKIGDEFGPLYNGVFSARMPIKLMNGKTQYLLEKWAEPSAVWAMMRGKAYPKVSLDAAWKELLKNQQHDGIGGCHVDRISHTMLERYRSVQDISNALVKTSLTAVVSDINLSSVDQKEIAVVVFNSTQYARSETVKLLVDIPWEWSQRQGGINSRNYRNISVKVKNSAGESVKCQVLSIEDDTVFGYLKFGNVIDFDSARCLVAIDAKDVPAFGYDTYILSPSRELDRPVDRISPSDRVLENEFLKATICADGTLSVTEKKSGKTFDNIHYFEDTGDKGGPLKFDAPFEKGVYTTLGLSPDVSLVYNGNLMATYKISYKWNLPESLATELKVHVPHGSEWVDQGVLKRSDKKKELTIDTFVTLYKDSDRLDFKTIVDNTICDHRLRVKFKTGFADVNECWADSPYDVVKRDITVPDSTGWYEDAAVTWPSQSFVTLTDKGTRASVIHNSIPEYEVEDNADRAICLTLLRAFGNAGNPTELYCYQELAQCGGKHTFEYSFEVGSDLGIAEVVKTSALITAPMKAAQTTAHDGTLETKQSFTTVSSEDFIVTCVKKAENEETIIIRGYGLADADVKIDLPYDIKNAKKVTLEELDCDAVKFDGKTLCANVKKGEIASFMISL